MSPPPAPLELPPLRIVTHAGRGVNTSDPVTPDGRSSLCDAAAAPLPRHRRCRYVGLEDKGGDLGVERVALLCFPHAGAGPSAFREWVRRPSDVLDVRPLAVAGREKRFGEPLPVSVEEAVDDLLSQVAGHDRVAMFGHSLGAALAFEAARRLVGPDGTRVLRLFVSGSPSVARPRGEVISTLDDDGFVAGLERLTGYAHPALAHPAMREVLLPVVRSDVRMHESYRAAAEPLDVPITVLRGESDHLVSGADAAGWRDLAAGECEVVEAPGGHMYLVDHWPSLLDIVERRLLADLRSIDVR